MNKSESDTVTGASSAAANLHKMATDCRTFNSILLFISITGRITALPHAWSGDSQQISTLNNSHLQPLQPYHKTQISDHINTQRRIPLKETDSFNRDNLRSDGKIIFPSDFEHEQPAQFVPNLVPNCENSTFCENTPNYPSDYLETALRMNKELKLFSGVDMVPDVEHRINTSPEDTSLCETHEKVVYPKVAQSKDKEWLFVVNQGDFTQGVRVETCGNENGECNLIDGFAEGYKTICKQKYIYRQLVAVSPVGQIKPEMFRFPASCCCHIKFSGSALIRFGMSSSKRIEKPVSKA